MRATSGMRMVLVALGLVATSGCSSQRGTQRDCSAVREPVSFGKNGRICDAVGFCWANPWPQGNDLRGVWTSPASDVWAVGAGGTILHFDGTTWSLSAHIPLVSFYGVWGSADHDIWAVGSEGAIYHFDGRAWMPIPSGVNATLRSVWGFSALDVWAVGDGGVALHFDGTIWSAVSLGTTKHLRAVWGATSSDLWIGGDYATLLHGDGQHFEQMEGQDGPEVEFRYYSGFWGSRPDDVWIVGGDWQLGSATHWNGRVFGGGSIREPFPTLRGDTQAIWGSSSSDVIAVGKEYSYRFDGTAWRELPSVGNAPLNAIAGLRNGDAWVVGDRGQMVYLRGCEWTQVSSNVSSQHLSALWASGDDDVWAFGGGAFHWDGERWTSTPIGITEPLYAAWGSGPKDVWAAGASGKLIHWNGSFWTPFQSPVTMPLHGIWGSSPNDVYAIDDFSSQMIHWDGRAWSVLKNAPPGTIHSLWGSSAQDIWAIGKSEVFHYDGNRWSTVVAPFSGGSVWGRAANDVWFLGSPDVTHFDGKSFQVHQPGFSLDVSSVWGPSSTDVWFASSRGFITHFDGSTWSNLPMGNEIRFPELQGAGHTTWMLGVNVGHGPFVANALLYRRP